MRSKHRSLLASAGLFGPLVCAALSAPTQAATLTGQVTSAEEGSMEGVVVSARKQGSTITLSVVTDQKGQYSFPADRLDAGPYAIAIRAAGYNLDGPKTVDLAAGGTKADIRLVKTKNLADELSNAEWLISAPGPDSLKNNMANCVSCHTLQRVFTSVHDAAEFKQIFRAHGRLRAGLDADASAKAPAGPARRPLPDAAVAVRGDIGVACERQPQYQRGARFRAADVAATQRCSHPGDLHGIRSAAQRDAAP